MERLRSFWQTLLGNIRAERDRGGIVAAKDGSGDRRGGHAAAGAGARVLTLMAPDDDDDDAMTQANVLPAAQDQGVGDPFMPNEPPAVLAPPPAPSAQNEDTMVMASQRHEPAVQAHETKPAPSGNPGSMDGDVTRHVVVPMQGYRMIGNARHQRPLKLPRGRRTALQKALAPGCHTPPDTLFASCTMGRYPSQSSFLKGWHMLVNTYNDGIDVPLTVSSIVSGVSVAV